MLLLVAVVEALKARGTLLTARHLAFGPPDDVSQGAHHQEEDDAEDDEGVFAIQSKTEPAKKMKGKQTVRYREKAGAYM